MRHKHYYYLSALLIIIIIIYICIEYFVSNNYYYYNSGRMNKIQKDLFENNKIEYNEKKWNIYIPNGYNFIDIELSKLKLNNNGKGKYIFGLYGCDWIVSKNGLWYLLVMRYGRDKARYIMPETFILHDDDDINTLKENFGNGNNLIETFILKKNIQRKNGLKITNNKNEILNGLKNEYKVAQKYIKNTYLVNGRKLNIRIYILVIYKRYIHFYLHRDTKCIYTNKEYKDDINDFESNITSYNMDYVIYDKNPFSIEELNEFIYKKDGIKIDIFDKIKELMKLVSGACTKHLKKNNNIKNATAFQLFGIDILLTKDLIPYILEINKGPDMKIRCQRDKLLKEKVYDDIYDKIGIIKNKNNKFIKL